MKKNTLSDIYANKVLLNEEKSNVVKGAKELDSKIDAKKAHPVKGQGPDSVKDLETPEEIKKYSNGPKAKKVEENMEQESEQKKAYEGSFERLFKATLTEDFGDELALDVVVPTSDEEMNDEIEQTEDEVSDLVSDLKSVIDNLQSILGKLSEEGNSEAEAEANTESEMEAEFGNEESNEEGAVKEAVEAEEKGHALHNLKAGTDLMKKSSVEVKGAVKVSKGKADGGDIEADEKLKPAKAHDKALQNPKAKPEVKSTVKVGDFFK